MVGEVLQNRYRLDAEIGRGGMGIIYRAHDTLLERTVAVKVLANSNLGTEGRTRLLREAQAVARLNHPNIVTVHDAGEANRVPFIVMELVDGVSLHEHHPHDLAETVSIVQQVCQALDHAHSHGIIHRDMKPENVIVTPSGLAKLMDFGLARSVASRLTGEATVVGTVFYLAPEQALGQPVDHRVDLYSLGVMLYELSAGRLPFTGDDPLAIISQHIHAPVVPPSSHNSAIPPALEHLIVRLMSKRPDDRPASAADVGQALAHLESAPAQAEELPLLERIGRGRLVARERELADMEALWKRTAAGDGAVLLLSGEPGIGKTRLVSELMTRAQVGGGRAFLGACFAEAGAPYAPVAQIIRQSFEQAPPSADLPAPVLADLVAIVPSLRARYPTITPNPALDPAAERERFFESVVAWCESLAARSPLLLVLDDAHWADSGTLLLLRHLAQRTRKMRVLLLAAYREVDLDEARPWHQTLVDLNRERLATRIKLGRLNHEQTREMLAAMFQEEISEEFLDAVYRETEGTPFFVEEVCKALIEDGKLTFRDGHWQRPSMAEIQVPQSVRIVIQMRVGKLPAQTQETLRLAAILGREFEYETLLKASDLDEDSLITVLENAERAQLINEVQSSRPGAVALSFAHALIPSTLRESVSGLRRQRLHRRAASAIEVIHPDDYGTLAYHYHQAGDIERARRLYHKAGQQALTLYAYREAEQAYRVALELGGSPSERAELLGGLGEAIAPQGRAEEAIASWREAITLYRSLADDHNVAHYYTRCAETAWEAEEVGQGLALAHEGLAAVAGRPETPGLAALLHQAARASYFGGAVPEALPLCQRALDIAERLHLVEVKAQSLITLGLVLMNERRFNEAMAADEQALELAESSRLISTACRAHNNLGLLLSDVLGDWAGAAEHYRQAAHLARQSRSAAAEVFYLSNLANTLSELGDVAGVNQLLPRMREAMQSLLNRGRAGLMLESVEMALLALRGELEPVIQHARDQRDIARQRGDTYILAGTSDGLAWGLLELGRAEESLPIALEAVDLGDRQGSPVKPRCILAEVYARLGRFAEARHTLAQARALAAGREPMLVENMQIALAEARLAGCERDWPTALVGFQLLAETCARLGLHPNHARVLREWADLYIARGEAGDSGRAHDLLQQALIIFEQVGATGYIKQVKERLQVLDGAQGS